MNHLANLRVAARRQKAVDDPLLNRLGLQVARTVAARAALRASRARPPVDPEVAGWFRTLRERGVVVVADFLDPTDFAEVRAAALDVLADPEVARDRRPQGANDLEVVWRADLAPTARSVLDRLWCEPRLQALASAAERMAIEPGAGRCTLQHLVQHEGDDLEAELHVDTFHPTHKAWLYLTDVRAEDGPLRYYPGSHRLDAVALRHVYRESVGANAGSRRVGPDEISARGLVEQVVLAPANTLVVADTFGYHGRVQGHPGGERVALQLEWRPDPFRRPPSMAEDTSRAAPVGGGGR